MFFRLVQYKLNTWRFSLVSSFSNSNKKEAQNGQKGQNGEDTSYEKPQSNQEEKLNNIAVIQKAESPVEIDEFPQPEDLEQGDLLMVIDNCSGEWNNNSVTTFL